MLFYCHELKGRMRTTPRRTLLVEPVLILAFAMAGSGRGADSRHRVRIAPHFAAGQIFNYDIQLRTITTSQATGPIIDPQGQTKSQQSVNVSLRLEVLSVTGSPGALDSTRLRATYEKVAVNTSSNSYDPDAAKLQQDYEKLEGRSIEFTLHPDGKISDVSGVKAIVANPARAAEVDQWLSQLTLGASLPRRGIAVGEKWASELPVENTPLTGLAWRTESTYAQEEPCPPLELKQNAAAKAEPPANVEPAPERCAIIYSHSVISKTAGQKDRTPEMYRQNGLRTFGEWSGESDALTAISLRTGMAVSVTQSGTTRMDFTISTAATGNHIHYAGEVESQAQITLTSESIMH
jgi:hypothetical protein